MLPKRFDSSIEKKWQEQWKREGLYNFNIDATRPGTEDPRPVYSIDTPPPFTSGTLHLGHIYNHTWIDIVARYKRMAGFNVLLPQGFDCHGLPTELSVEKKAGVDKRDREKFLKACIAWTDDAVAKMKGQFDLMGYSTDWAHSYRTMDDAYKKRVQKTLLMFYEKDLLYREKHPVLWCWKCGTALAKAEVGYIEKAGKLYFIDVDVIGGKDKQKITLATTRPEMMPACVAVFVHPEDARYKNTIGKKAKMPLFGQEVPIIPDEDVDKEFGTGVVYLCTFGDEQDIRWQKKYKLPVVIAIEPNGRMSEKAGKFAGMKLVEAQKAVVEELQKDGRIKKIEDLPHNVLCHTERSSCENPIELLPMEQWFIKVRDYLPGVLKAGRGMRWFPPYTLKRLEDWCESMDWDWIISRQRTFGTPIPFWVCQNCKSVIPAKREELPVDPRGTTKKCKCGGEAKGESDVCDCWVDSSLTALTISKWDEDEKFFKKTYPATMRPQGYEIIRTWTFYTIFRSLVLTGHPCFKDLMINGMVAGPDGRKMSKSYGNVVGPETVLQKYPADAMRQWGAAGTLGEDYPFSWEECEHSAKFLNKLWNVAKFVEGFLGDYKRPEKPPHKLGVTDRWILSKLQTIIENARANLDAYTFNIPLQEIRSFVWHELADYYLEMVKHRLYKPEIYGEESKLAAQWTLSYVLENILKLLAPITPHITEEVYTDMFKGKSIHLTGYPKADAKLKDEKAEKACETLVKITDDVRKYKSDKSMSLGADLEKVVVEGPDVDLIKSLEEDIKGTNRIKELGIKKGADLRVSF